MKKIKDIYLQENLTLMVNGYKIIGGIVLYRLTEGNKKVHDSLFKELS